MTDLDVIAPEAPPPKPTHRRNQALRRAGVYAILLLGTVFMALPFYWMITSSLKTARESQTFPPTWIPSIDRSNFEQMSAGERLGETARQVFTANYWTHQLRWDNYPRAWNMQTREGEEPPEYNFTRFFMNSVIVAVGATVGSLLTSVLAAYALATMNFIGAGVYFFFILGTLYIPGHILLIPNYIMLSWLGTEVHPSLGLNTYFCLIVPWIASVFSIFLLRQSFLTLPKDLHDAARIDGAGHMRHLFMIVLPLSKPTLITAGLFTFLSEWNTLLWPLIMAYQTKYNTIMVGLSRFRTEAQDNFDLLMAASAFSILPIVVLFFILQRFFIAGIARTGLK